MKIICLSVDALSTCPSAWVSDTKSQSEYGFLVFGYSDHLRMPMQQATTRTGNEMHGPSTLWILMYFLILSTSPIRAHSQGPDNRMGPILEAHGEDLSVQDP